MCRTGGLFDFVRVVEIVPAVAVGLGGAFEVLGLLVPGPEPGEVGFGALGFGATVFGPLDVGLPAEDAGTFLFDVLGVEEGADVEADAVVEVRVPADGLLVQRLPTDEKVVRWLAGEDVFEFLLEKFGGGVAVFGTGDTVVGVVLLAANPIAEVGVGEGF